MATISLLRLYFIKANLYPFEPPEIFGLPLAQFSVDHRTYSLVFSSATLLALLSIDVSFSLSALLVDYEYSSSFEENSSSSCCIVEIAPVNGLRVVNRVQEARISKDDFSFSTRSFIVRFQQEEIQMFDAVTFTLKLPFDPLKGEQVSLLEVRCLHLKTTLPPTKPTQPTHSLTLTGTTESPYSHSGVGFVSYQSKVRKTAQHEIASFVPQLKQTHFTQCFGCKQEVAGS